MRADLRRPYLALSRDGGRRPGERGVWGLDFFPPLADVAGVDLPPGESVVRLLDMEGGQIADIQLPRPELRVALGQEEFGQLVRGGELERAGARIRLLDIGWAVMLGEIRSAIAEASGG
jgi:hypothetical protein